MAGEARLNVYNLGEAGVNLTKSPIHQSDGDLLQAQNAIRSQNNIDGGIAKRESFNKLNSVALQGAVQGIASLPLPNPLAAINFYAFRDGTPPANSSRFSTGGTTWADNNTLVPHADANAGTAFGWIHLGRAANNPKKRRFYYFGEHDGGFSIGQAPPIYSYDGVDNVLLCRLPGNPVATVSGVLQGLDMLMVGQTCYVSTYDGSNATSALAVGGQHGSVYRLDENGQLTRLGIFDTLNRGAATCMTWWLGKLWVGLAGLITLPFTSILNAGNVYSIRPFIDTDWTAETTVGLSAGNPMVTSMCSFLGDLYISTCAAAGTASLIKKRTPAGVWSTVFTNPDTGDRGSITHLTVYDGVLYAQRVESSAQVEHEIIKSSNGTVWTIDRDVAATDSQRGPGPMLWVGDDLYTAVGGGAILRKRSGTWTNVDANNVTMRGQIAYIRAKN